MYRNLDHNNGDVVFSICDKLKFPIFMYVIFINALYFLDTFNKSVRETNRFVLLYPLCKIFLLE